MVACAAASDSVSPPKVVKKKTSRSSRRITSRRPLSTDSGMPLAIAFEKQYGVPYPSLYDPTGKLMLRFKKGTLNPQLIPTTIIVDRDGKIAARALQALSEDKLREMLDPVIAEK